MSSKVLSEASPRELEFTLQVRNNRLKERRLRLGMSQSKFVEAAQISLSRYRELELLRASPQNSDGSWKDVALALSAFHAVEPEELFPEAVLAVKQPSLVRKIDGLDLRQLMTTHQHRMIEGPAEVYDRLETGKQITRSLATLSPREEKVIRLRFGFDGDGEHTLDEVSEKLGVTRERIRQVEAKGLRKLRHPERAKKLEPFMLDGKGKKARQEATARLESAREAEHDWYMRDAKARVLAREENRRERQRAYHNRIQERDEP